MLRSAGADSVAGTTSAGGWCHPAVAGDQPRAGRDVGPGIAARSMSRLLRQVLVLFVLVFPAVARAAGWENWFAAGSVLQIGDATVISAGGDGDFAGVHSTAHTGPLQARNVRLSVMSPDWSSVRQLQVLLSTEGNFESVTFTDLRELLLVAPEGEWIELTVPTGAWQSAVRAEEAWVNAVQVRVTAERGRTALVAFRDFGFVPAYQGAGAVTIAFDDARSDVFDYAFSQLQQRGLTGTVYVIPEYVRSEEHTANSSHVAI